MVYKRVQVKIGPLGGMYKTFCKNSPVGSLPRKRSLDIGEENVKNF